MSKVKWVPETSWRKYQYVEYNVIVHTNTNVVVGMREMNESALQECKLSSQQMTYIWAKLLIVKLLTNVMLRCILQDYCNTRR